MNTLLKPKYTFASPEAVKNIDAILASLRDKPKTVTELEAAISLKRKAIHRYMAHLRDGENKRIYVCDGNVLPNGVLAPIYAEGNLPDKEIDKCRFVSPNDWFELRKQALAKRIRPPAWSADPMLAWIPARSVDYREAA